MNPTSISLKNHRFVHFLAALFLSGVPASPSFADNGFNPTTGANRDVRTFDIGAEVKVLLNFGSFHSSTVSFPASFTQDQMEVAIRRVIANWTEMGGVNLKVKYAGTTTKTTAGTNEIVIIGSRQTTPGGDAAGNAGPVVVNAKHETITIFRDDGHNSNYDWVVFKPGAIFGQPEQVDFVTTLTHEMGHAFGLQHNNDPHTGDGTLPQTVMNVGTVDQSMAEYGPYYQDFQDLVALYGTARNQSIAINKKSSLQGTFWNTAVTSDLAIAITGPTPSSGTLDVDRSLVFFSDFFKQPRFGVYDANIGLLITDPAVGNPYLSFAFTQGGVAGHGYGTKYMATWVDARTLNVKVSLSTNSGVSFGKDRSPSPAQLIPGPLTTVSLAIGTPAVCRLDTSTWLLCYAMMPANSQPNARARGERLNAGTVVTRISTDDGLTWGPEVELAPDQKFRSMRGVTATAFDKNNILIGFASSYGDSVGNDGVTPLAPGAVVTITAHLDSNNKLVWDRWAWANADRTPTEPSFTASQARFFSSHRDDNAADAGRSVIRWKSLLQTQDWTFATVLTEDIWKTTRSGLVSGTNTSNAYIFHTVFTPNR